MSEIGQYKEVQGSDGRRNRCLPSCETEKYNFMISESVLGNPNSFHHTPYFCPVLAKVAESCGGPKRWSLGAVHRGLCGLLRNASRVSPSALLEAEWRATRTVMLIGFTLLHACHSELRGYSLV